MTIPEPMADSAPLRIRRRHHNTPPQPDPAVVAQPDFGIEPPCASPSPLLGPGWRPSAPSLATRTWALSSQGSMRALLASIGDRLIRCETGGERNLAVVASASPGIVSIREQPDAVSYVDDEGIERRHTADFLVVDADGRRVALDYRPDARADKVKRLVSNLNVNEQGAGDVNAWRHIGDAALPRSLVKRADLIGWVRRDGPTAIDPKVVRMREVVERPMTVAEAVAASGCGGDGFRAVVRLIADGEVRTCGGWSITYDATIEPLAKGDRA